MLSEKHPICHVDKMHHSVVFGPECTMQKLNRIGYVLSGTMTVDSVSGPIVAHPEDVFFLEPGHQFVHCTDNFFCISLCFDDQAVFDSMNMISPRYDLTDIPPAYNQGIAVFSAWPDLMQYFQGLHVDMEISILQLRLTELMILLFERKEYKGLGGLVHCIDRLQDPFEKIVKESVFENLSINEMAARTNRCLTIFKNDFQRRFKDTPHQWIIKQRLLRAKQLIVSTSMSIKEIANASGFDSTSHFIKLFKRTYRVTPLVLRKSRQEAC